MRQRFGCSRAFRWGRRPALAPIKALDRHRGNAPKLPACHASRPPGPCPEGSPPVRRETSWPDRAPLRQSPLAAFAALAKEC